MPYPYKELRSFIYLCNATSSPLVVFVCPKRRFYDVRPAA